MYACKNASKPHKNYKPLLISTHSSIFDYYGFLCTSSVLYIFYSSPHLSSLSLSIRSLLFSLLIARSPSLGPGLIFCCMYFIDSIKLICYTCADLTLKILMRSSGYLWAPGGKMEQENRETRYSRKYKRLFWEITRSRVYVNRAWREGSSLTKSKKCYKQPKACGDRGTKTSPWRNQKAILGPHRLVHSQSGFNDSFAPSGKNVCKSMEPGPGRVNDPWCSISASLTKCLW